MYIIMDNSFRIFESNMYLYTVHMFWVNFGTSYLATDPHPPSPALGGEVNNESQRHHSDVKYYSISLSLSDSLSLSVHIYIYIYTYIYHKSCVPKITQIM
jgi:hypothetical protein